MRSRQDIVELFSTFAQFEADRFGNWITDARLKRNMRNFLRSAPEMPSSESFWATYWHKAWQSQAAIEANLHLSAYLQEPCYWATQHLMQKLSRNQARSTYELSDYFQIAIAELNAVLKGFNPERGASLKTYANMAFSSLLRDQLRQRQEADICTHWMLLRKSSRKRFLAALQQAGLPLTAIEQYRLAWWCFTTLYAPTAATGKLPALDAALWQAIADRYNTERLSQLATPGPKCTPTTIEQWLVRCANWIRAYAYPPLTSLSAPKAGAESGYLQDDLPSSLSESLLADLIAQEDSRDRQTQQQQVNTLLLDSLTQLEQELQEILRLYYQDGQTQKQIADALKISQPSVARRLSRARKALLTALVEWSQTHLNTVATPNLVEDVSVALEEWLAMQYGHANQAFSNNLQEVKE